MYSGLTLFQHFFSLIGIKERLRRCFRHLKVNPIYAHNVMVMLLVVHLIIGRRRLRDLDYYRDDEVVKRVLGLKRLPDVSTRALPAGVELIDFYHAVEHLKDAFDTAHGTDSLKSRGAVQKVSPSAAP